MPIIPRKKSEQPASYEGQLAVDVFQTDDAITILAPIAGVRIEDINIAITDNIIKIHGTRMVHEPKNMDVYLIQECFWGPFSREIILPSNVDSTKVTAQYKDGILTIGVPKTSLHAKEHSISISN